MKPQTKFKILTLRATMLLAGVLGSAAGCSKNAATSAAGVSTVVTPTTTTTTTSVTPTGCTATVAASIVSTNMTNAQIAANADVLWQVTATGCPSYNLVRKDGSPSTAFSGTITYTTRYSQLAAGIREYVDVQGLNSAGTAVSTLSIMSAQFSVLNTATTTGTLSCNAVANPTLINVRVDSAGNVIDTAVPIYLTVLLNKPGYITSLTTSNSNGGSQISIASGVPSAGAAITQLAAATNFKPGLNTLTITVSDAATSGVTATCLAALQVTAVPITGTPCPTVPPVVVGPPAPVAAPTCVLTASQTSANPGAAITLSLNGSGAINNADIEGYPVNAAGGQLGTYATSTKTYSGHVYGPGGLGSCQVTVVSNPVTVNISFEDLTDNDFNDVAICANGAFQITGKQIISVAPQTARLRSTKLSACNHQVELFILDQSGNVMEQHNYISDTKPTFDVTFMPGWQYTAQFHSLGSCANGSNWSTANSSKVQVGYYCRNTGN